MAKRRTSDRSGPADGVLAGTGKSARRGLSTSRKEIRRGRTGRAADSPQIIWGVTVGLALAVFLVFRAAVGSGFVFDDYQYLVANPAAALGLTPASIWWSFTSTYASNWHPLTWLSHLLDVSFFGLDPAGHHLVNVIWHAANTVTLCFLLTRLTGEFRPSAAAAAIFAMHPLQVESVAWVAERKNLLSTFFLLLTILAWRRYVERPGRNSYALVVGLFLLGLMAKPMVVTLPVLLLLVDIWPLDRLRKGIPPARLLLEKVPLLLLSGVVSAVTIMAQRAGGSMRSVHQYSLPVRAANALVSYVSYLGKIVWPVNLATFYPHPGPGLAWWKAALAALILLAITGMVLGQARKRAWLLMGWCWYLVALVPVIGLVQVGDQAMADRYAYLPLIGPAIIIAWGGRELMERRPGWRDALRFSAGAALVALALAAAVQTTWWKDNETLFRRALAVTRDNWFAHISLAASLGMQGDLEGAVGQYREALKIRPRDAILENNMAFLLGRQGKIEEARALFNDALALKPDYVEPQFNLGVLFLKENDFAGAESQAVKLDGVDRRWAAQLREFIRYKRGLADGHQPPAP